MDAQQLERQLEDACRRLRDEMNGNGFWSGKLSSSALAVSVSIVAFQLFDADRYRARINRGLGWLFDTVGNDGGFGDTPGSESNISTSLLCYASISLCSPGGDNKEQILKGIASYLRGRGIDLQSGNIARSILDFYGKDLTFSVPILSMLAICRVIGEEDVRNIPQLPFELSLLPHSVYRFFNLQVVSYAIPALIAVGIYLFRVKGCRNPLARWIRNRSIKPSLRKLEALMPGSGGFLEAIPLTAFTSMCLISCGYRYTRVVEKGLSFLEGQQRPDGSWPIDTDLSTWVTTLSVKALGAKLKDVLNNNEIQNIRKHLLDIQYKDCHPFNMASPGGWGWTSFAGSVPDADDTPGAVLALLSIYGGTRQEMASVLNGCIWLVKLQNRDGGMPTFCKGWGRLPFDRSCADLTGHALLAWVKTLDIIGDQTPSAIRTQIEKGIRKAVSYLQRHQHPEGFWLPLWFGSQQTPDKTNPLYGTARVGAYLNDCLGCQILNPAVKAQIGAMLSRAQSYIVGQQNNDGSWGAVKGTIGTIEETALAVSALTPTRGEQCCNAIAWLNSFIATNGYKPSPIGLYFAALWYDERMYPITFHVDALRRYIESNR
jgi:squalene-hopene/tetraprenyl-beta-curcumene cyclase